MKVIIPLYDRILKVVRFFSKQLKFDKYQNKLGRKLALTINETISLALFKQKNNIATKKSLHEIFNLKRICSYKTLAVSLNRWSKLAMTVLFLILKINRKNLIKHKKWVEGSCSLSKEYLKGKNFREKTLSLTSMPLDRYFINRYFNLLKSFFKEVIKICNFNLSQEKFESILNKLKKESEELQWIDKHFKDYCRLEFSYYQKIIGFFNKKFLYYGDDKKINEIVKKIKEII